MGNKKWNNFNLLIKMLDKDKYFKCNKMEIIIIINIHEF